MAVSMVRGRAGLTSTSNLATSGESSQARILAAIANSPGAAALEQFRAAGSSSERFLVLNGASSTGKTMWARCFSAHPELMQWFIGDTCGEPDLRAFKPSRHKPVLFDEATAETESEKVSANDDHAKHARKTS